MQITAIETTNMTMLPLSLIAAGTNPRKHFDQKELAELTASIKSNGVLQPILVRPVEGGYTIVAGERRFRAAMLAFGEEGLIPAVVKDMTDAEADRAALIENTQRADMSVTEEAVASVKLLEHNNGDKDETAASLGWPMSKLLRRLALNNLTEEVMNALNERTIVTGHAELLASIPQSKQGTALQNIITRKLTVQQVRDLLVKVSTEFSKAIFDTTTDCANCNHNSSKQATLFDTAVEAGRCTNSECFKAKTAEKINAVKVEVEEEFPNVRLIEVGDPATYVSIVADGGIGVGEEQFNACKGCANYGATISAIPGEEGNIERSICFDAACHQKKIAAQIRAGKAASETEKTAPAAKTAATTGKSKAKTEKKATASSISERVKEYRRKTVWNTAASAELWKQQDKASSFMLDLLMTGTGGRVDNSKLQKLFNGRSGAEVYSHNSGTAGKVEHIHELDAEMKLQLFAEAAASAVHAIDEARLKRLLSFLGTDLGNHWTVSEEFFNLLTKSEIEAVCTDIGVSVFMPDFKKVIGGKRPDAIKAIITSGFDFTGKIPSLMAYDTTPAE